jgi:hypothetical protein
VEIADVEDGCVAPLEDLSIPDIALRLRRVDHGLVGVDTGLEIREAFKANIRSLSHPCIDAVRDVADDGDG